MLIVIAAILLIGMYFFKNMTSNIGDNENSSVSDDYNKVSESDSSYIMSSSYSKSNSNKLSFSSYYNSGTDSEIGYKPYKPHYLHPPPDANTPSWPRKKEKLVIKVPKSKYDVEVLINEL